MNIIDQLIRAHVCPAMREDESPSTSIAAAWQVVEKMRIDGWAFMLTQTPTWSSVPPMASFCKGVHPPQMDKQRDGQVNTMAFKPCEAICLAALQAVGVAVPDPPAGV